MSHVQPLAAVLLLVGVLGFAVARPRELPEVVAAVPAAAVAILTGAVTTDRARDEIVALLPVVSFLAAILVLAHLCQVEGLFVAAGRVMAQAARGRPVRLLVAVFVMASAVTAVLGLDATVVLLTPVVFLTASQAGVRAKPAVYACTHLANSASLLLPTANLTNLIALPATGLTFSGFAAVMALPWIAVILVEYVACRRYFAAEMFAAAPIPHPGRGAPPVSTATLVLVGLTLVGFVASSLLGLPPAWAAAAGCVVLGVRALQRRTTGLGSLLGAANLPFCLFVLALGVLVAAVVGPGVSLALGRILPSGSGFPALLGIAVVAAVLANLLNNLPATLILVPLAAQSGGSAAVLAVLLGVNLGPNLTYVGSLATLLWRRVLREHDEEPSVSDFSLLGALSVPATIVAGAAALWVSLAVLG